MIITETIIINDIEYLHTYSSSGFTIERDGVEYGDAIDPIDSNRIYTETQNKIEQELIIEENNDMEDALKDGISYSELKELATIAKPGLIYYKDKYYLDPEDTNLYQCINEEAENGIELYYLPHDLVGAYFILIENKE